MREKKNQHSRKDIFDRFMGLPGFRIFEPFYVKYKEMLLYLFFGGLAFVVSVATYSLFNMALHMNELIANIYSWIITVLFAFLTNRIWVFQSPTEGVRAFLRQMMSFYGGRVITLFTEEAILFVFITLLSFSSLGVKIAAQIVVIILNYVISKLLVFRDEK